MIDRKQERAFQVKLRCRASSGRKSKVNQERLRGRRGMQLSRESEWGLLAAIVGIGEEAARKMGRQGREDGE